MATAAAIVSEAFKLTGTAHPSNTLYNRALDEWLPQIFEDIAGRKDWGMLEDTQVSILTQYVQTLSIPADFESMRLMTFYDGYHKDTAQAGAASNITLAADEDLTEDEAKGKLIFLTSGTGSGGMARITDYDDATKVASISPNWGTNPDVTSKYMVSNYELELNYNTIDRIAFVTSNGIPVNMSRFDNEIYFDPIPDLATYAVVSKYLTHIASIDTSGTRYAKLLTRWRLALQEGIIYFILKDASAKRTKLRDALGKYELSIIRLKGQANRANFQSNRNYASNRGGFSRRR